MLKNNAGRVEEKRVEGTDMKKQQEKAAQEKATEEATQGAWRHANEDMKHKQDREAKESERRARETQ